jgi:putative heme iron utilization protein
MLPVETAHSKHPQHAELLAQAISLLNTVTTASLGTLQENGAPCVTLVNIARTHQDEILLCLSGLSLHTQNLIHDARVSLLLVKSGKGDPLTHPRLSVFGEAIPLGSPDDHPEQRECFLKTHPKAKIYMPLPDFRFWQVKITSAHLNGGFARAANFDAGQLSQALRDSLIKI